METRQGFETHGAFPPHACPGDAVSAVLVVGAGLSGAVIARTLAEAGQRVHLVERRPHLAGNCHTARDPQTGVMVHHYGPHIFHTANPAVWAYVNRFARLRPYRHTVRTTFRGQVFALPINLTTINQFFGLSLTSDQARAHIAALAEPGLDQARNFEEQALRSIGRDLYEAFFQGYTQKQWGRSPRDLPAAVLRRLPLRFTADDSYFSHPFQGIPEDGYTAMVEAMLDHPAISVRLGTPFSAVLAKGAAQVFWTGPLDHWFGADEGALAYRSLRFQTLRETGDFQGCAVMNFADVDVPQTRITEFRHFTPWETHSGTTCYLETSHEAGPGDEPFYPVRLVAERALLARYVQRARGLSGICFVGRLGTYRYIDMDVAIHEAQVAALAWLRLGGAMPAFAVDPLTEEALV